jgi:glutamyl/glutaminyl-tRNA synthetase
MDEKVTVKIGITPSNAPFRICNMRTFLYIYAFLLHKQKNNAECKLIFKIDDTNPNKRLNSNEDIITFYEKLGIINQNISTQITSQSNNTELYDYYYEKLKKANYIIVRSDGVSCFNIEKFKQNYGNQLVLDDMICGEILFSISSLTKNDMFAIKRSDGTYLYHFATCIDNINLKLTHIIRGKNKLSSAAYQIIISKCLEISTPKFIHLPLLLNNKNANNKINNRSLLTDLLNMGYDVFPIFSYLFSSGCGDSEIIYTSINDFAEKLDITKIHRHDGNFDINILNNTQKNFFKNVNYEDYVANIMTTSTLIGENTKFTNDILSIGYKYHLSYTDIKNILKLETNNQFELISNNELELLNKIILILTSTKDIDLVIKSLPQYNKKEIYKLIRYYYTGTKKGYNCSAIKEIFEKEFDYKERTETIKKKTLNRE